MKASWLDRSQTLSSEELLANGVYYARLDTEPARFQTPIDQLKSERGYIEQDEVVLSPSTPNLDAICAKFVDEHFHDDDEVRFVLEGEGIFDIRSRTTMDRVVVERGD